MVPKQNSTGGKERMGSYSKQGDRYLRWLLVAGAMAVIRHGRKTNFVKNPWLADLVHRKAAKVAAVALANKNARTAWALLAHDLSPACRGQSLEWRRQRIWQGEREVMQDRSCTGDWENPSWLKGH